MKKLLEKPVWGGKSRAPEGERETSPWLGECFGTHSHNCAAVSQWSGREHSLCREEKSANATSREYTATTETHFKAPSCISCLKC